MLDLSLPASQTAQTAKQPNFSFDGTLSLDYDLSYLYYEELENDPTVLFCDKGNGEQDYLVLFESAEQKDKPYFKKSHLRVKPRYELDEIWRKLHLPDSIPAMPDYYTKNDIIDELLRITNADFYTHHRMVTDWDDLECDYIFYGYSQRQAVAVNDLSKGKHWTKKALANVLYEVPMTGVISVYSDSNHVDFIYLDEFLEYLYAVWSLEHKEKLISDISKHYANKLYLVYLKNYLASNLPDDYNEIGLM